MEAPLHHLPVPLPPTNHFDAAAVAVQVQVQQQEAVVVAPAMAGAGGREQCPRCASRDTKFCYYNNYNTAQPRHFCRACRRYWTLGGSLRNVPIGGSTRKRPRPARPTRAAVAAAAAAAIGAASASSVGGGAGAPFFASSSSSCSQQQAAAGAEPVHQQETAPSGCGLLGSSLLGTTTTAPLLALGAAPLLEGWLGFDLGLGQPGDVLVLAEQLAFGAMAPAPLLWPARILEGDTWKDTAAGVYSPAAALWQELAAAAPVELAAGLRHAAPQLM